MGMWVLSTTASEGKSAGIGLPALGLAACCSNAGRQRGQVSPNLLLRSFEQTVHWLRLLSSSQAGGMVPSSRPLACSCTWFRSAWNEDQPAALVASPAGQPATGQ